MFSPSDNARVFGVPPGADFPRAVATGVLARMEGKLPEDLARVRVLVNTRRMQRRLRAVFAENGALLLPRIGLITELDDLALGADLPSAIPPLRRRLELARLVAALLDADPSLAPRSALFDLADSLAALLDEMQGEGVDPAKIAELETGDLSGHWARSQKFLTLVQTYLGESDDQSLDAEAHRRAIVTALKTQWAHSPPTDPVLVVGSTGSRGTTAELMGLVARLPQGALILPGFDDTQSDTIWSDILSKQGHEDHPQYRFAVLLKSLGLSPNEVETWSGSAPSSQRNRLISLSLRPAPVTHQWLSEGPRLGNLIEATKDVTLIEAPNQRKEAAAIAVAMRRAIEDGKTVALVTPDRTLGRRVTSTLRRWNIVPDDSAGRPLAQTAPGRLLRQIAHLMDERLRSEDLIALLRHPLTQTDGADRGPHLLMTQEFELFLRKKAVFYVSATDLIAFADVDPRRTDWASWVTTVISQIALKTPDTLLAHLEKILGDAEVLAAGPDGKGSGELWERSAGRDTKGAIDALFEQSGAAPKVVRADVARLLDRTLQAENTRNSDDSRPDVMIWGTLEARVQGADVVILGGLNEGIWPSRPGHDPWLNRRMRASLGMLLPERQIGLAAHDYQQAIAANQVILSRSLKDDDAETVSSRWLNRLTNLMSGLQDQNGRKALKEMRDRGSSLLDIADGLDRPSDEAAKEVRPSPAPPVTLRPKVLSVTDIETLIRDPYSIYARYVLGLRALKPLRPAPDAAMRGTVFHEVLHRLMRDAPFADAPALEAKLLTHTNHVLEELVPWPSVRALWRGHLEKIAPRYAELEMERLAIGRPIALEVWGECQIDGTGLGVKGKADRIDSLNDGRLAIYDYKSGAPPSTPAILHFKRQLPVEAVMAEAGAFNGISPEEVAFVSHIGLNSATKTDRHDLIESKDRDLRTVTIQAELSRLLTEFMAPGKGYPSRRAMEKVRWDGDYDHLARFGEWTDADPASLIVLP